jgi:hypothetical protein
MQQNRIVRGVPSTIDSTIRQIVGGHIINQIGEESGVLYER